MGESIGKKGHYLCPVVSVRTGQARGKTAASSALADRVCTIMESHGHTTREKTRRAQTRRRETREILQHQTCLQEHRHLSPFFLIPNNVPTMPPGLGSSAPFSETVLSCTPIAGLEAPLVLRWGQCPDATRTNEYDPAPNMRDERPRTKGYENPRYWFGLLAPFLRP